MAAKKKSKPSKQSKPEKSKPSMKSDPAPKKPKKSEKPKNAENPGAKKKKPLITYAIIGLLLVTVIALAITLIVILMIPKPTRNVCETPECITLAHQLLNWRDESVDPCQDFFKYSCGKYNEHSADQSDVHKQNSIVEGLIKEFLVKKKPTSSKSEKAMQMFYEKCEEGRNATIHDEYKLEQFKAIFEAFKSIGPWPMIDATWTEKKFNLEDLLHKLATTSDDRTQIDIGLFSFLIVGAQKISIFTSDQSFLKNLEHLKGYTAHFLRVNGLTADETKIENEIKEIKSFADEIQNIFQLDPITAEHEANPFVTNSEWKKLFPNLEGVIKGITAPKTKTGELVFQKVKMFSPLLMPFGKLMVLVNQKEKRIVANFLFARFFTEVLGILHWPEKVACEKIVMKSLPAASIRVFVRNHFDKGNLKVVSDMVETIRETFVKMLQESTWLSAKSKEFVIKKAKEMKKIIGYPEEFEKEGELDRRFDISLSPTDSFFNSWLKIHRFDMQQTLAFVSTESSINPITTMLEANAFYLRTQNSLTVLPPMIDNPLFHSSYPAYAKFAGVGFTIAHEFGHAYSESALTYDENGGPTAAFDKKDELEYKKRMQCVIDQYDNYDDPDFGKNLIGNLTIVENVADFYGADVAWRAFKALDLENEPKIVGFEDYSLEKLFFQIAATGFCSSSARRTLEEQLKDKHGTQSFRVNGVLANRKEFAETFNCPVGSPMNPEKKCQLF